MVVLTHVTNINIGSIGVVGAFHIIQGVLLWLWRLEEDDHDAAWKERITDIAMYMMATCNY